MPRMDPVLVAELNVCEARTLKIDRDVVEQVPYLCNRHLSVFNQHNLACIAILRTRRSAPPFLGMGVFHGGASVPIERGQVLEPSPEEVGAAHMVVCGDLINVNSSSLVCVNLSLTSMLRPRVVVNICCLSRSVLLCWRTG